MSTPLVRRLTGSLLATALAIGLAACGSPAPTTATTGAATTTAPSQGATVSGTAVSSSAPTGSVAVTPVTPALRITGPGGETVTLPAKPQRIVCLTGLCDDVLVELGLAPVGTSTPGLLALPEFMGTESASVTTIPGSFGSEDVESIAALKPDLVVGLAGAHDQMRSAVEQFAPLWLLDVKDWKSSVDYLRAFATLTDRPDQQVAAEQSFDTKLAAARAASAAGLKNTTALTMYVSGGGQGVNTQDDLLGGLMSEVFTYPWPNKGGGWDTAQAYSFEEILAVDPQIVFIQSFTDGPDGPTGSQQFASNPVWQQVSAVKNGKVIEVDTDLWTAGRGPRALGLVLDQAVAAAS